MSFIAPVRFDRKVNPDSIQPLSAGEPPRLRGLVLDSDFRIDPYPVMPVTINKDRHAMWYLCPWCGRTHEHKFRDGDEKLFQAGEHTNRMTHCDVWREFFAHPLPGSDYVLLKLRLAPDERRWVLVIDGLNDGLAAAPAL